MPVPVTHAAEQLVRRVLSVQTQQSAFPGCLRRFKGTWVSALTLEWI